MLKAEEGMNVNPYECCPRYETKHFLLRQVQLEDAYELLNCYSDPAAVANMNADFCTSDFYFTTMEQMEDSIRMWQREYAEGNYVRLTVLDRQEDRAAGTIEIFGGEAGVLRIDLATKYEQPEYIEELLRLAMDVLTRDFPMDRLCLKAEHAPVRRRAAAQMGFQPSKDDRSGLGYYEWRVKDEA